MTVVVEVEDGRLQLRAHAVRAEEALDGVDERVLAARRRLAAGDVQDVAEHDHVRRDRQHLDDVAEPGDRRPVVPFRRLDPREAGLGVHVAGMAPKRRAVGLRGRGQTAHVEADVAELHESEGDVLGHQRAVGRRREQVGLRRRGRPPDELSGVGDARVGGDAGREQCHVVVRREGLAVTAEVEQRVAESAVGRAVLGIEPDGAAREV